MEPIKYHSQVIIGVLIVGTFREGNNVSHTQDGKLDTLQRIAIGVLAVAQGMIRITIGITLTDGFAQYFLYIALTPAGGDEGIFVPNTVFVGVGPVKLPNCQGCLGIFVDHAVLRFSGKCCGNTGKHQNQCQTQGKQLFQFFH